MRNFYVVLLAAVLVMATASSVMACPFNDASASSGTTQTASSQSDTGS